MPAARAAARNKPVLVVKAGRGAEGARAAASHTGALAGSDAVYDAALRRAGLLRVDTIQELFDAVETLARAQPVEGSRLAIMTNGGGPGVMAADAISLRGGQLAAFSEATTLRLNAALPATWSHGNPVDIIGDASVPRYVATLEALLADKGAYAIPVAQTRTAASMEEAVKVATQIGFPVALKISSPQITHKSDVGGVALGLANAQEVQHAAAAMTLRLRERAPSAQLTGYTVQEMVVRPTAHELIVGAAVDAVFGPVILFGQGGVSVEIVADRAVALPPLNMTLAADLVSRTRVARLLEGYRDRPPANREALSLTLVKVSQLVVDIGEIAEFAILVRSDIKGHGLGSLLMKKIIRYCAARGTSVLTGSVLRGNERMLALARELGFSLTYGNDAGIVQLSLRLAQAKQD